MIQGWWWRDIIDIFKIRGRGEERRKIEKDTIWNRTSDLILGETSSQNY